MPGRKTSTGIVTLPEDSSCSDGSSECSVQLNSSQEEGSTGEVANLSPYVANASIEENDAVVPVSYFDNVSVVNSNNVHFGNKTIYQGPVIIKQILHSNNSEVTNPQYLTEHIPSLQSKEVLDGRVYSSPRNDVKITGVDNAAFEKDYVGQNGVDKAKFVDPYVENSDEHCWPWNHSSLKVRCVLILTTVMIAAILTTFIVYLKRSNVTSEDIPVTDTGEEEGESQQPLNYTSDTNGTIPKKVRVMSRLQWLAQPPTEPIDDLKLPVSYVIIQHTASESCQSEAQCIFITRYVQMFHIESQGWSDIGYNFLVGGDGNAYEGRGWHKMGSHLLGYNNISIGVGFIGTFISYPPPANQIAAFKHLIEKGVKQGYLTKDYKILAARQLQATKSPGEAFYEVIKTWNHWAPRP